MFQIRIHGRGGQGVVTAAEMLALAGFMEGHHAQAFPSFGSERTGAPVTAFARLAPNEIRLREPVLEPDVVLVQDRTLPGQRERVLRAFAPRLRPHQFEPQRRRARSRRPDRQAPAGHVLTVPATRFAMEKIGRPLPGAAMLAGMAAMTGTMKLESVQAAYNEKFKGAVAAANAEVASMAFEAVKRALGGEHA